MNELDGDYRKVSLILTPPVESDKSDNNQAKKKKKGNDDGSAKKSKKKKLRFRVRLVFGTQFDGNLSSADSNTGWIPSARLFPDRCNNKVPTFADQKASNYGTPTYNNALATDMHHHSSTQILHSVSMSALKAFSESLALLKIWCLQRGFLKGQDTFSETNLALSLAYLYRSKLVSARMDSIQVFTVWMKFISDEDWLGEAAKKKRKDVEEVNETIRHSSSLGHQKLDTQAVGGKRYRAGIVMPEDSISEKQTILKCIQNRLYASDLKQKASLVSDTSSLPKHLLESFKMNTDAPIFLDPSMTVNYFGNISPSFIREVQRDAKMALDCIHFHRENSTVESSLHRIDPFRQLFLEPIRFWRRYDAYISFDLAKIAFPAQQDNDRKRIFWGEDSHDKGSYSSIVTGIVKVLRMALGDRITALRIMTTGNIEVDTALSTIAQSEGIETKILAESDGIHMIPIRQTANSTFAGIGNKDIISPLSQEGRLVIGVSINGDTCHRIVDRGPPADDTEASADFVSLWGKQKAQLRRFKDGAIVHAAVWNEAEENASEGNFTFESGEKVGDIVESIIRHILREHFVKQKVDISSGAKFKLRNLLSIVEGAADDTAKGSSKIMNSSEAAHKGIMSAFDKLSQFLKDNSTMSSNGQGDEVSKLGLPLAIDAVEPLSPSLRYSSTFPQVPHPLLGSASTGGKKVAGAIIGDPILIQIRFEGSSKWPTDINAMGAAKCALLTQIADGIDEMKETGDREVALFDGPMNVSPTHIEFGYCGYVWRIIIRADQEMKMLNQLRNPSAEAIQLRQILRKNHITKALHHFTIHGVHSKQSASGQVTRIMHRWIAAHMLSGQVPTEAIELLVASVFTDPSPLQAPVTAMSGFMRCLHLIGNHEWSKTPLVVDPEGHIDADDRAHILSQFEAVRGASFRNGPSMYIISPNDRHDMDGMWRPSFTQHLPEYVVLGRLTALAKRSYLYLMNCQAKKGTVDETAWESVFQEKPEALKSYSVLFRVSPENIIDPSCSSTGGNLSTSSNEGKIITSFLKSMEKFNLGPKVLRKKVYKNLNAAGSILYAFKPVDEAIEKLRAKFGKYAVFFYNEFCPDMIAMLWRPSAFQRQAFSAMHAEFQTPIEYDWGENGLVTTNSKDVLRAIKCVLKDIIINTKVLDDRSIKPPKEKKEDGKTTPKKNAKRKAPKDSSSSD